MNYELALELKKAGFPFYLLQMSGGKPIEIEGTVFAKPTLTDLIEACGEEFRFLSKDFFGWVAVSNKEAENPEAHMHVKQICQTPEEAVARLWLALQKK